jgi:hypothetical protein
MANNFEKWWESVAKKDNLAYSDKHKYLKGWRSALIWAHDKLRNNDNGYFKIIKELEYKEGEKMKREPIKTKEQARQKAIDFQQWQSAQSLSYGELAKWAAYFEKLAEKFGLRDEFRENGII